MTRYAHLASTLAIALAITLSGCGDGDDAVDVTGTWDVTDVTGKSVTTWSLTQSGNSVSGLADGLMPIGGTISGSLMTCAVTMGPHSATFNVTISGDGNSLSGTWANDTNDSGILSGVRRGTGEGADLSGTWLSVDLETSASLTMQITQNGALLTGTTQGATPVTIQGTISGSEVSFRVLVGQNYITWTGHLSADGNTVTGGWVNSGTADRGSWRMTRG